jgi:hypothetical protein
MSDDRILLSRLEAIYRNVLIEANVSPYELQLAEPLIEVLADNLMVKLKDDIDYLMRHYKHPIPTLKGKNERQN